MAKPAALNGHRWLPVGLLQVCPAAADLGDKVVQGTPSTGPAGRGPTNRLRRPPCPLTPNFPGLVVPEAGLQYQARPEAIGTVVHHADDFEGAGTQGGHPAPGVGFLRPVGGGRGLARMERLPEGWASRSARPSLPEVAARRTLPRADLTFLWAPTLRRVNCPAAFSLPKDGPREEGAGERYEVEGHEGKAAIGARRRRRPLPRGVVPPWHSRCAGEGQPAGKGAKGAPQGGTTGYATASRIPARHAKTRSRRERWWERRPGIVVAWG